MTPGEPLLQVRDLKVTFRTDRGTVQAVDGVSFDVARGETLAIVGESGSGKSVTSLAVMGLLQPGAVQAATIRFDGQDLLTLEAEAMRRLRGPRLAMIFQDPMTSLNPVLTVGRQLSEMFEVHRGLTPKASEAAAADLLTLVGVPSPQRRLKDYPHQFSGGMRQRVMIAMAVACDPALLIADEPTTALDVTIQAQILDLLARLQREFSMALVLITHDLGVVAGVADRMLVMYAGRVVEEGPTEAVFARAAMPYTAGLIASVPRFDRDDQVLVPIPGAPRGLVAGLEACSFAPRCHQRFGACDTTVPGLISVGAGHRAACLKPLSAEMLA